MPRPRKDLDQFRDDILRRIDDKHTHNEIRSWLAGQGLSVSKNTLSTRCVEWEANRTKIASSDTALVSAVNTAFHTTQHNNETIADNITASGISTTHRQVKRIRLAHGWRRRGDTDD
jgi:hypothetical protein